jgi:hypothetical protein
LGIKDDNYRCGELMSIPCNPIADILFTKIEKAFNRTIESERFKYIEEGEPYDLFAEGYAACYQDCRKKIRELEKQLRGEEDAS